MNIEYLRKQLKAGKVDIEIVLHARIEAAKDGIEATEVVHGIEEGEVIEDYGARALILDFTAEGRIPFHLVLEYVPFNPRAIVVTVYIPDTEQWLGNWKTRKSRPKGGRP